MVLTEVNHVESNHSDRMFLVVESLFGLSLVLIMILSIYNLKLKPSNKIFVTFESYMREEMDNYFKTLNQELSDKL